MMQMFLKQQISLSWPEPLELKVAEVADSVIYPHFI